jgi:hypothetical protein
MQNKKDDDEHSVTTLNLASTLLFVVGRSGTGIASGKMVT